MTLKGRSIVSIGDLSRAEIELIFRCAERFAAQPRGQTHLGRGFQLATLFFEPSTRTRLSFESAMNRLGGAVLTVADGAQSSASKGETLSDTARIVSAYADVIVLRHPAEGAARVAADAAGVPVINGGDGAHEHPTQTLCDLYTLGQECGKIEGLTVTLYGDLKYGRTVHSLAYGLALFGGRIIFAPADPALAPPAYVLEELRTVYGVEPEWWDPNDGTPMPTADALYLTRVQKERFSGSAAGTREYPRIDKAILQRWGVPDYTVLMHPLPRAGELDPELDSETRSAYFRQGLRCAGANGGDRPDPRDCGRGMGQRLGWATWGDTGARQSLARCPRHRRVLRRRVELRQSRLHYQSGAGLGRTALRAGEPGSVAGRTLPLL